MDHDLTHYKALGLPLTATADDIKQAYRTLARTLHPDKGGSSAAFSALQTAFEVLIDPKKRAAYDACAADVRFRPGAAAPYSQVRQPDAGPAPPPGATEAVLLQQLLRSRAGSIFDPTKQLCVTCEVCTRPATKECWTCHMPICDFCTRRQHWKGELPLHWPLVNSPGRMLEQLGKQELEAKRKEDAAAYKASLPGYRPQSEMLLLREFQDAIVDLLSPKLVSRQLASSTRSASSSSNRTPPPTTAPAPATPSSGNGTGHPTRSLPTAPSLSIVTTSSISSIVTTPASSSKALTITSSTIVNRCYKAWLAADPTVVQRLMVQYDNRLGRFYMWAQSPDSILLAVQMPTGGTSQAPKLDIEVTPSGLKLQHQGFAPVLNRAWSKAVDASAEISSWVSCDGQLVTLLVPKAVSGSVWDCCFKGDSYGARCLQSPYSMLQLPHEVQLELQLPFWVVPEEDLQVVIGERMLTVAVDGLWKLQRTYWKEAKQSRDRQVLEVSSCTWCVLDENKAAARGTTVAAGRQAGFMQKRASKALSITLALPAPTQEEIMYKKGARQNNATVTRNCPNGSGETGFAFFAEDEDEFGLQGVLQALMFSEIGRTWISPEPWNVAAGVTAAGRWEADEAMLPSHVQQHLKWLRTALKQQQAGQEDGAAAA